MDTLLEVAHRPDLDVRVVVEGKQVPPPPTVDAAAHRLVQECLSNVGKHPRATAAALTLHYETSLLTTDVADDGIGAVDIVLQTQSWPSKSTGCLWAQPVCGARWIRSGGRPTMS